MTTLPPPPTISAADRSLDQAAAQYRSERAALYDAGTGRPLYVAEEQARREQALQTALRQELAAVNDTVQAARAAAERERTREHDLVAGLSSADLERAAARRPFVEDDFKTLPAARLVERTRAALEGGAKVEQVLHHREAQRLLDTWRTARREGRSVPGVEGNEFSALEAVVAEIETRLVDSRQRVAAEEAAQEGSALAVKAGLLQWELFDGGAQHQAAARAVTRRA